MADWLYIILVIILIYIVFDIGKQLQKNFYRNNLESFFGLGWFWIIALIFPKRYFREDNFWEGYLLYILSVLLIFMIVFLFTKIGGLF
jgi:hypothetical protein